MPNTNKSLVFFLPVILVVFYFQSCLNHIFKFHIDTATVELPSHFPPPAVKPKTIGFSSDKFLLGKQLFFDPILSIDSTISCSTCHQQKSAFSSNSNSLSIGLNGAMGRRNAPTLQNILWQNSFMWDGKIEIIAQQPILPITHPGEMGESIENVFNKLKRNEKYIKLFLKAYKTKASINSANVMNALSQYMIMLISSNSKYDLFIDHKDTLSPQELNGLKTFRKDCASCHQEPLFTNHTFQRNGIQMDLILRDEGRAKVTGNKDDYLKFKVPTLRNIERTYPYMHDGRFFTLEEVVNHYSSNPIPSLRFNYTQQEKKDLILFLKTLTDEFFCNSRLLGIDE